MILSEEEQKAIIFFDKVIYQIGEEDINKNAHILLKVIDRLQKELEQEKEKNKELVEEFPKILEEATKNAISKDKIKDKIEELKEDMVQNGKTIDILYDILEGE